MALIGAAWMSAAGGARTWAVGSRAIDRSAPRPILTVLDFSFFLKRFAGARASP